jgi:prepilin-type N-terminal cleavage/methylation domain-containing protein
VGWGDGLPIKARNNKHQLTNKFKLPNDRMSMSPPILEIGSLVLGICLDLDAWCLRFRHSKDRPMPKHRPRGFTMVEMLVVIAIIAILAALLLPAVMMAIRTARNTAIALEIKQIDTAIEAYRLEKGDYPPNFRDPNVVRRHIVKCYPRIDQTYFQYFMNTVFPPTGPNAYVAGGPPLIDESESLVFWLSMTDTDAQFPFLSFPLKDLSGNYYPTGVDYDTYGNTRGAGKQASPKRYYDFDQTRLVITTQPFTPPALKAFSAKFCGDSNYVYIDSRSYNVFQNGVTPSGTRTDLVQFKTLDGKDTYAIAGDIATSVRPYWSTPPKLNAPPPSTTPLRNVPAFKPANQTTFQIICAGQDGDFGIDLTIDNDVKVATGELAGTNYNPTGSDKDNITNFSNGRMLGDLVP